MLENIKTNYLLSLIIIICIMNIFVMMVVADPETVNIIIYVSLSAISAISILVGVKNMQKKKAVQLI